VAAGIFLSRLSGLLRQMVFARFFGTSPLADAWTAALKLPNVLQNLLGEGSLSASFIPAYAELLEEGREEDARRLAGAALGILFIVAGALALLGSLLAPWIVDVVAVGMEGSRRDATIALVRILFPMTGVLVAWALGILNSHRQFFVSYSAPILWNLAIVSALVTGGFYLGLEGRDLLLAMGWGALVGGVLQFGIQLPWVFRVAGRVRPSLDRQAPGLREAVRNFVPVVGARGFENVSSLVREVTLASLLIDGAVAVLGFVQILYVLPISLFGLSVAAAELPELSRLRKTEPAAMAQRVASGLLQVRYWVLFRGGAFARADTVVTYAVLAVFSVGLLASASSRLLSNTFFALRDAATPARIAVVRILVALALGAALMLPLDGYAVGDKHFGAAGLAAGAATGAWLEYVLLRTRLSRRIGRHGPDARQTALMLMCGVVALGAGLGAERLLVDAPFRITALGTLGTFGVAYLLASRVVGLRYGFRGRRR
jgi:putative peptidoglycan lipid II flippase